MAVDEGRLLTAKEMADDLHVNVETIYRKAQAGEIPVELKVGPRWRFSRSKVRAALAEQAKERCE